MSDKPEINSTDMGPHFQAVYQISRDCDKQLLRKLLRKFPTIDHYVENITKSVNRKWMSDRPEIESHDMGPRVNAVYQI